MRATRELQHMITTLTRTDRLYRFIRSQGIPLKRRTPEPGDTDVVFDAEAQNENYLFRMIIIDGHTRGPHDYSIIFSLGDKRHGDDMCCIVFDTGIIQQKKTCAAQCCEHCRPRHPIMRFYSGLARRCHRRINKEGSFDVPANRQNPILRGMIRFFLTAP